MKIQIIGFSGSGKSTLAKLLGENLNIPHLHLDRVHFYGDWQERTIEEQSSIVSEFIRKNEDWVIDGNYSAVARERFSMADLTIFLDFNRFTCYWRSLKRYLKHRGKTRDSLGCIEKFDFEFQWWILHQGRTKKRKIKMMENFNLNIGRKMIFKNQRALNKWLKEFLNKGE